MVKLKPIIALFGGSFDPPHKAHQEIVTKVSSFDDIDKLIVMPAYLNPFKKSTLVSPEQRLKWCRELCESSRVIVSDFEVSQGHSVYTIDTIRALEHMYDVKYLVIGSDNLVSIEKWKGFDEINIDIIWLVITRGTDTGGYSKLREYRVIDLQLPISSTEIRSGHIAGMVDSRIVDDLYRVIKLETKETNDNPAKS